MSLVVVTGMSGAGKSKAINTLEDMGYYCVDNLPPRFLVNFADLYGMADKEGTRKIATVVDVRGKEMFSDFFDAMEELKKKDYPYQIMFLDAEDAVLRKRYKETRRVHPLIEGDDLTLEEAIRKERNLMQKTKEISDYVIDTSSLLPAQLKQRIVSILESHEDNSGMLIQLISFGYKHGLPAEADLVFDVRFLPNPYYIAELKEHNGTESCIRDYVLGFSESTRFRRKLLEMIDFLLPLYQKEGKSQLEIAFGCTGGKHRSVLFAELLKEHLQKQNYRVLIEHRDIKSNRHGDFVIGE